MSRIRAALVKGENGGRGELTTVVREGLGQMVARLAGGREDEVAEVVLVGNTVMHHLFSGCDVEPLSHAPFASTRLGVQSFRAQELGWPLAATCSIQFEDALAALLARTFWPGLLLRA